jgi:hypothetical protein
VEGEDSDVEVEVEVEEKITRNWSVLKSNPELNKSKVILYFCPSFIVSCFCLHASMIYGCFSEININSQISTISHFGKGKGSEGTISQLK